MSSSDDEQQEQRVIRSVSRNNKEQMVADLLCRWWYVLPDWPPVDYDFNKALEANGLRLVTLDRWEEEAEKDNKGRIKCYALTQYVGVYRDATGSLRDLRPKEGKPCFSEFMGKTEKELKSLIVSAIQKQMEILQKSDERNLEGIIADLKEKLKKYKK